jgi:hypothetical protein
MSVSVELPDALHDKLRLLGGGLFTVPEVIERLAQAVRPTSGSVGLHDSPRSKAAEGRDGLGVVGVRAPRERGATVEIAGHRIHAGTVSDLYEQAFRLLLNNGNAEALKQLSPYRTSNQRYLFAREPKHPNGNDFFIDVKVGQFHIEAHKSYEQAIKQLAELLARIDVSFRYLG